MGFLLLTISTILIFLLLVYVTTHSKYSQLQQIFSCNILCVFIISFGVLLQDICSKYLNVNPIYFEYFIYIGTCYLPVSMFFTGLIFTKTKITFKRWYILLFIIPIISLLVLWTNPIHHLFYQSYSTNINDCEYGKYIIIHQIYSFGLLIISALYLAKFSVKNSGFFSRQSILIVLGISIPIVINLLGSFQLIPMTVYVTPIAFSVSIICCALAIFKFNFLGVTPIALQKVVDRISDSYLVLNEDLVITDFNQTFIATFKLNNLDIREMPFKTLFKKQKFDFDFSKLDNNLEKLKHTEKTIAFEQHIKKINKTFTVEINAIHSDSSFLGTIILFKDITQHIEDMKKIKDTQETLMESERLSSLGQLIGGIAHNLKTPIMSISGAAEGLTDLVKEYDSSIDDPEVNSQDHHDIAKDMFSWIEKIKDYTEYMSDIITAVKGQAVTLSETENVSFDLDELVKRVNILMKHELKSAVIYLNIHMNIDSKTTINGDVNSLVQVINNMISNAIQAYNGKEGENIDLILEKQNNYLIISVKDYGSGLPEKVKNKLFKEMITTKGKNGTGLGLYMSYSTIKAHFNGDITFESEPNKGTTFNITLPL